VPLKQIQIARYPDHPILFIRYRQSQQVMMAFPDPPLRQSGRVDDAGISIRLAGGVNSVVMDEQAAENIHEFWYGRFKSQTPGLPGLDLDRFFRGIQHDQQITLFNFFRREFNVIENPIVTAVIPFPGINDPDQAMIRFSEFLLDFFDDLMKRGYQEVFPLEEKIVSFPSFS
jgi:hypothetical protein